MSDPPIFRDPRDKTFLGLLMTGRDSDPLNQNWVWPPGDREEWKEVGGGLQGFYEYWRGRRYGSDLRDQFPYTLSLGVSGVDLPLEPNKTTDNKIVITKSYHEIYYRILDVRRIKGNDGGAVLIGQPGVGKTIFLNFMLARLISAKQVVLLFTGSTLLLFFRGTVYERKSACFSNLPRHQKSRRFHIWTLINADALSQAPLIDSPQTIWPVQACSPEPILWKAWSKQRGAVVMGMPVCSRAELLAGLPLCPRYKNFETVLKESLSPNKNADQSPSIDQSIDRFFSIHENVDEFLSTKENVVEFLPTENTHQFLSTDVNVRAALNVVRGKPYDEFEKGKEVEGGEDDMGDKDAKDDDGDDSGGDDGGVGMADEAGKPQHSVDPFKILLQNAIEEFGFAPRDVYDGVFDLPTARAKHNAAVWQLDHLALKSLVRKFTNDRELSGISHHVVAVHPFQDPQGIDGWQMGFKSVRIGEKVARLMRFVEKQHLRDLYKEFHKSSETTTLAGWVSVRLL